MKKWLFRILLVLALAVSGYTACAWNSTRGLKIYLMKTKMGAFLASTWQIALLAAILLWLPVVIVLLVRLSRRAKGKTPSAQTVPVGAAATVIEPRRAASVTAAVPVQPTAPMEETELIPPAAPAEETELIPSAAPAEETELIPPAAPAEETELIPPAAPAEETIPLEPAASAANAEPAEAAVPEPKAEQTRPAGPRFCARCGNPVTGKFCARCGAKVER